MPTIAEPARRLAVSDDYDVVVVGGGIAGVAAAVAAARAQARVCLLDKQSALGGLATLGNVTIFLPLCDGLGRQVCAGLAEEMLKLSVKDGFDAIPACWRQRRGDRDQRRQHRYRVNFNPVSYMIALENFLLRHQVSLYYDARFCAVVKHHDRIKAVIIESKSGRTALTCRAVIDATGDADVCRQADEPTVSLNSNVRCGWFNYHDGRDVKRVGLTRPYDPYARVKKSSGPHYAADDIRQVTRQIVDSRRLITRKLQELQKQTPDQRLDPWFIPTIATFRMTRRLQGAVELTATDDHRPCDEVVGLTGDWRRSGPVYALPLRCLTGVQTPNLLVAGRCISADNTTWDVVRAIPTCAVTGQAAGAAAALLSRTRHKDARRLPLADLQQLLRRQKVLLDMPRA